MSKHSAQRPVSQLSEDDREALYEAMVDAGPELGASDPHSAGLPDRFCH